MRAVDCPVPCRAGERGAGSRDAGGGGGLAVGMVWAPVVLRVLVASLVYRFGGGVSSGLGVDGGSGVGGSGIGHGGGMVAA